MTLNSFMEIHQFCEQLPATISFFFFQKSFLEVQQPLIRFLGGGGGGGGGGGVTDKKIMSWIIFLNLIVRSHTEC